MQNNSSNKEHLMFVISGPSGSGKTSAIEKLLSLDPHLRVSVSATTRPKRPLEQDGKDYYFMTPEEFKTHEFAECAEVYGHSYGTLKSEIHRLHQEGCDIIFNKDYQGLQNLKKHYDVIGVFIKPPSLEVLQQRLKKREQDSPEVIQQRLEAAEHTMKEAHHYDHSVVNNNLDECVQAVYDIIQQARA
jgi:guanylate kinase